MLRESNLEADELAQVASGVKKSEELTYKLIVIGKKNHNLIYEKGIRLEVINIDAKVVGDWNLFSKRRLTGRFPIG